MLDFDTRLKVAWVLTLLALAVAAGELLPSQVAGTLVLALSAAVIWLRGHVQGAVDRMRTGRHSRDVREQNDIR